MSELKERMKTMPESVIFTSGGSMEISRGVIHKTEEYALQISALTEISKLIVTRRAKEEAENVNNLAISDPTG